MREFSRDGAIATEALSRRAPVHIVHGMAETEAIGRQEARWIALAIAAAIGTACSGAPPGGSASGNSGGDAASAGSVGGNGVDPGTGSGAGSGKGVDAGSSNANDASVVKSCGYYESLTQVCDGDTYVHKTEGQRLCHENDPYCYTNAPHSTSQDTGTCLNQSIWTTLSFEGTCADFAAYNRGEFQCLTDDECGIPQAKCVAFNCTCNGQPCPKPTAPGGPGGSSSGSSSSGASLGGSSGASSGAPSGGAPSGSPSSAGASSGTSSGGSSGVPSSGVPSSGAVPDGQDGGTSGEG